MTEYKINYSDIVKDRIEEYNYSVGNLDKTDGYNCEECKNKGFIDTLDDKGNELLVPCRCKTIRETLKRARQSGLGNILEDCTFDKFIATEDWQKEIKDKAQAFCNDDAARWFYIGGQVGSGKSHICAAIGGHYIKAGSNVVYMMWASESKRLKSLVNEIHYQKIMDLYKAVDVLYIDDFLKVRQGEQPTSADISLAFEIINQRLLYPDKITIISSEKTLDEIMEYDEATMSRIYQKTGTYKINIGKDRSKNYRLKD